METFDFYTMQINWRGEQYPFREVIIADEQFHVLVSVVDLERVLLDVDGTPVDRSAEWVDSRIAYYVDSGECLLLNDKVLQNMIYRQ